MKGNCLPTKEKQIMGSLYAFSCIKASSEKRESVIFDKEDSNTQQGKQKDYLSIHKKKALWFFRGRGRETEREDLKHLPKK